MLLSMAVTYLGNPRTFPEANALPIWNFQLHDRYNPKIPKGFLFCN
ncbi:hypothetical protein OOU_Y34scaffold00217g7 [Pyricularia oryzae Y34]|uniref:Uncharacterized protein n=2 Tax=Pyricularia oryzae TaxID=318829 RepID=A0AA97P5C7_PYRO3|nr:hypothetical protein OOU_Y34scaffold00217g7 [Pyricularia oryzae Y34]